MTGEYCRFEPHDELDISHRCLDEGEQHFATVIGYIEDILMDEGFIKLHSDFMENHWQEFDDAEENKLVYTDVFEKYTETIEKYIESELLKAIPEFRMMEFEIELNERRNELDGEIFDILETFTDFISFKEKFLDYKAMKEGKTADFTKDLCVIQYNLQRV